MSDKHVVEHGTACDPCQEDGTETESGNVVTDYIHVFYLWFGYFVYHRNSLYSPYVSACAV